MKGYGFLSFGKNIGTHATKVSKNISNKYSHKLVDSAKKSATDAIKTASKRATQKTAEVIGNKIADKITSVSKKSKDLHSMELHLNETNNKIPKERYISPQERRQIMI